MTIAKPTLVAGSKVGGTGIALIIAFCCSIAGCQVSPQSPTKSGSESPASATNQPTPSPAANVPTPIAAGNTSSCSESPPIPAVPRAAKQVLPGSGSDDTASIQQALNGLKPGDWLVFPAGTYHISRRLDVRNSGVTLYGQSATIQATNPTDGAIMIEGDNVAIYGFTLEQNSTNRQGAPWSGGISVYNNGKPVHGAIIQNNTVKMSAAAGIFLFRADHFTVANNTVWRSWADGIHMTAGSTNGRVIHNTVSENGDDMIAVVSYAGDRKPAPAAVRYANWSGLVQSQLDRNIYIYGNQLSDQYWGRGISVIGGSDVTIDSNTVSKTPLAAAIYLMRETYWMTFGDHNILVNNNSISDVETLAPSYKPPNINIVPTHQSAIELGSVLYDDEMSNTTYREALSISDVRISGNTVRSARFAGIGLGVGGGVKGFVAVTGANGSAVTLTSAPGPVFNVIVQDNHLSDVAGKDLMDARLGLDIATISCERNVFDGAQWPTTCTSAVLGNAAHTASVTGASLKCTANGELTGITTMTQPDSLAANRGR